ncbi:hypothetical protein ACFUAB_24425, partial [Streptomyces cinereoruber]|uniref:hypothetical protein n=1 Tax=Streptomyces cinereoruber TaxID=67260 RepID=UPI00362ADDA3
MTRAVTRSPGVGGGGGGVVGRGVGVVVVGAGAAAGPRSGQHGDGVGEPARLGGAVVEVEEVR